MSEPRRWNLVAEGLILAVSGGPSVSLQEAEKGIPVIEAKPILARIKQLETQLKEANAVAEFYGDESNWEETWCDFGDDGRDGDVPARIDFEDCEVCEDESGMYLGPAGKRARAYLKKWEGKS